ncbi:SDR family oxidoreductase [Massilia sp. METH4]|uniref:SDR family oxidoreductase n=1 Tax=Massilia sp. METH4 TaxID=3123041 RepID=UPI0030D005E2
MIGITGASGQLGRLVIEQLLRQMPASEIVALVRDPAKAASLQAAGVHVRLADYNRPDTLGPALAGVERLLLISSSEVGQRTPQHRAVIEAAQQAGVKLLAYTSLLHADTSPLPLAAEHKETEALLKDSSLAHVILRNGWYLDNYLGLIPGAVQSGVLIGCAGEGRISAAARADFALAAATVLTRANQAGRVYELAGDESFTLTALAAEISRQSGRPVAYQNMPQAEHRAALMEAGVPEFMATVLAESDAGIAQGALFDDGRQLSKLIGRPSTSLAMMVKAGLEQ